MQTPGRLVTPFVARFLVACLVVCVAAGTLAARRGARLQRFLIDDPKKIYYMPHAGWVRAICAGYTEVMGDLAWVRALLYFGEQTVAQGRFEQFDEHVELILELSPYFRRAYLWAGITSIYSKVNITRHRVEKAIEYLQRGVGKFPGDGEMHYMLGFDLYFELPPFLEEEGKDPQEIRAAKLEGIEHLKQAVRCGDRPEWLLGLVNSLLRKNGLVDMAARSIEENLKYIDDPEAQAQLLERLATLKKARRMSEYEEEFVNLRADWLTEYPYLPLDMYLLVRPRSLSRLPPFGVLGSDADKAIDTLDGLASGE